MAFPHTQEGGGWEFTWALLIHVSSLGFYGLERKVSYESEKEEDCVGPSVRAHPRWLGRPWRICLLVFTLLIFINTYLYLLNKCLSGTQPGEQTALPFLRQLCRPEAHLSWAL